MNRRHLLSSFLISCSAACATVAGAQTVTTLELQPFDAAPGLPGLTFGVVDSVLTAPGLALVEGSILPGGGVNTANDDVYYAYDQQNGFTLIHRQESNREANAGLGSGGIVIAREESTVFPRYSLAKWAPSGETPLDIYPVPGTAYTDYLGTPFPDPLNEGEAIYEAGLFIGPNGSFVDEGVWWTGPNGPQAIAVSGQSLPEIAPEVIDRAVYGTVANSFALLFVTPTLEGNRIREDEIFPAQEIMYRFSSANGLEMVHRVGMPAPGIPGAEQGIAFGNTVVMPSGAVTYLTRLTVGVGGVTSNNDSAAYVWRDGAAELLFREGDPVPGVPGVVFPDLAYDVFPYPSRTVVFEIDEDTVVFTADLPVGSGGVTPETARGMWIDRDGAQSLIFRAGDPAPGTVGGVFGSSDSGRFRPSTTGRTGYLPDGSVIFRFSLNPGVGDTTLDNDSGVWHWNGVTGETTLLFREETEFLVSNDPLGIGSRVIRSAPILFLLDENSFLSELRIEDPPPGAQSSGLFSIPVPQRCLADVNVDGELTPTDFTAWINAFNNTLPTCDQNGDGACTPTDFTAWINNFNTGC